MNTILARAAEIKKTINSLLVMMAQQPEFADVEFSGVVSGVTNIRNDRFFGMPPTKAAREYLMMKGSAATAEEILDGLIRGGFEFPPDWKENLRLKNLAISLKRNTPRDFVYLQANRSFGLWDFYPDKKREIEKKKHAESADQEEGQSGEPIEDDPEFKPTSKSTPKETPHPAAGEPIEDDPDYKKKNPK